jgi:hypothetical protein
MESAASWLAGFFRPRRELRVAAHVDPASVTIVLEGGDAAQPPITISARIVPGRVELVAKKEAIHE